MASLQKQYQTFQDAVAALEKAKKALPTSVPLAPKDGRIATVFSNLPVPQSPIEHWEIFDRRMNALYGEDTRNTTTGLLSNLQRGKYGLDLVVSYIQDMTKAGNLDWVAGLPKIERITVDLNKLKYVVNLCNFSRSTTSKSTRRLSSSSNGTGSKKTTSGKSQNRKKKAGRTDEQSDAEDRDYQPPQRDAEDSDGEGYQILDEDGNEISAATEASQELVSRDIVSVSSQIVTHCP